MHHIIDEMVNSLTTVRIFVHCSVVYWLWTLMINFICNVCILINIIMEVVRSSVTIVTILRAAAFSEVVTSFSTATKAVATFAS